MAVLVNGLTTVVGFGSMMLADHRGIFGLGLLLTLGHGGQLVAALVVLPVSCSCCARAGAPPTPTPPPHARPCQGYGEACEAPKTSRPAARFPARKVEEEGTDADGEEQGRHVGVAGGTYSTCWWVADRCGSDLDGLSPRVEVLHLKAERDVARHEVLDPCPHPHGPGVVVGVEP